MPEILTTKEAADYLRTSVDRLKRMAREGSLPAAKLGRDWRFPKAEIDAWLAAGGTRWGKPEEPDEIDLEMARESKRRLEDPNETFAPYDEVRKRLGL
jgi:excisionase family DNA binding protein